MGVFILAGFEAIVFWLLYMTGNQDLLDIGFRLSLIFVITIGPSLLGWFFPDLRSDTAKKNIPGLTMYRIVVSILLVFAFAFGIAEFMERSDLSLQLKLFILVAAVVVFLSIINFVEKRWIRNDLNKMSKER
jgi:hypothetical protein